MSETWLSPEFESNPLQINGYDLYRSDRRFRSQNGLLKCGGGQRTSVHVVLLILTNTQTYLYVQKTLNFK